MSRDDAYQVVQRNAMAALADPRQSFQERLREDPDVKARLSSDELEDLFRVEPYLAAIDAIYQRLGLEE